MDSGKKLLVTLDDLTVRGSLEIRQEIYMVGLGYRVWDGTPTKSEGIAIDHDSSDVMDSIAPDRLGSLQNWYFAFATPIFKIRKRRRHVFPGGLPLFLGDPGENVSFYLAIMESDEGHREAGKTMAKAVDALKPDGLFDAIFKVAETAAPQAALVKQGFSALVKVFELALLNKKDEIKYTNVFSFRNSNDYLEGSHSDFGNRRAKFTMTAELEGSAQSSGVGSAHHAIVI
ncbi:MAG: hypothetical protein AAF447_02295 [Myxococcota bacterium]